METEITKLKIGELEELSSLLTDTEGWRIERRGDKVILSR